MTDKDKIKFIQRRNSDVAKRLILLAKEITSDAIMTDDYAQQFTPSRERIIEVLYKHMEVMTDIYNDGLKYIPQERYEKSSWINVFEAIATELSADADYKVTDEMIEKWASIGSKDIKNDFTAGAKSFMRGVIFGAKAMRDGKIKPDADVRNEPKDKGYCGNPITSEDTCDVLAKKKTCEGCNYFVKPDSVPEDENPFKDVYIEKNDPIRKKLDELKSDPSKEAQPKRKKLTTMIMPESEMEGYKKIIGFDVLKYNQDIAYKQTIDAIKQAQPKAEAKGKTVIQIIDEFESLKDNLTFEQFRDIQIAVKLYATQPLPSDICVQCDQRKETHHICKECLDNLIKENKSQPTESAVMSAEEMKRLCEQIEGVVLSSDYYEGCICSGHSAERFDEFIRIAQCQPKGVSDDEIWEWVNNQTQGVSNRNLLYTGAKAMRDGQIKSK